MSLHRSPSTTGARQKWGVHTHAQPHVHATWDLKNLFISISRKESKLKRTIFQYRNIKINHLNINEFQLAAKFIHTRLRASSCQADPFGQESQVCRWNLSVSGHSAHQDVSAFSAHSNEGILPGSQTSQRSGPVRILKALGRWTSLHEGCYEKKTLFLYNVYIEPKLFLKTGIFSQTSIARHILYPSYIVFTNSR